MNNSTSPEKPAEGEGAKKKDGGSMRRRILTAVIAIPLLIAYFYFLSGTPGMPIIVAAASCAASVSTRILRPLWMSTIIPQIP